MFTHGTGPGGKIQPVAYALLGQGKLREKDIISRRFRCLVLGNLRLGGRSRAREVCASTCRSNACGSADVADTIDTPATLTERTVMAHSLVVDAVSHRRSGRDDGPCSPFSSKSMSFGALPLKALALPSRGLSISTSRDSRVFDGVTLVGCSPSHCRFFSRHRWRPRSQHGKSPVQPTNLSRPSTHVVMGMANGDSPALAVRIPQSVAELSWPELRGASRLGRETNGSPLSVALGYTATAAAVTATTATGARATTKNDKSYPTQCARTRSRDGTRRRGALDAWCPRIR